MKQTLSLFLALLLTVFSFTSCRSTVSDELTHEETTTPVLTNVFAETAFPLPQPDALEFCEDSQPYRDPVSGTYTFLAQNTDRLNRAYFLLTYDESGTLLTETSLSVDLSGIQDSVVCADGLVGCFVELDMETYREKSTLRHVKTDGTTVTSEDLAVLLGIDSDRIFPDALVTDAENRTYFVYSGEIFVLDEAFRVQFSLPCDAENVTFLGNAVYAGMSDGIARIDHANQSLGEKIPLSEGIAATECFAMDDFSLGYRTSEGIFGVSGDGSSELLLNFQNSNLIGEDVDILRPLDRDTFLLSDGGSVGLWNRAADIDLSDVIVLDVAYTYLNESIPEFLRKVTLFNQSQSAIRVVTKDYQVYTSNGMISLAEESTLVMDMLTGVYRPDVVVTNTQYSVELSEIYENGLYTDLYPLIDADETFSREELFGCVTRTFEDTDGNLGAICGSFRVDTLIGDAERLAGYENWTLSEMMEACTSVEEEDVLMVGLGANTAWESLLGSSGYTMFLDRESGTCSFDSPEFLAYLDFLKTLPESFNYDAYGTRTIRLLNEQLNPLLRENTYTDFSQWMNDKFLFEGRDVNRIGYVSIDGEQNGSYLVTTPYLITSYCDNPDEAWTFLREILFNEEYTGTRDILMGSSFPARKSDFEKDAEQAKEYLFGYRTIRKYNPEKPPTEADEPYARFTDEDAAEMFAWFDETVGVPYTGFLNEELADIVNEEISAYLGGTQTAEKCADIIQSRVNLWLSEHE